MGDATIILQSPAPKRSHANKLNVHQDRRYASIDYSSMPARDSPQKNKVSRNGHLAQTTTNTDKMIREKPGISGRASVDYAHYGVNGRARKSIA